MCVPEDFGPVYEGHDESNDAPLLEHQEHFLDLLEVEDRAVALYLAEHRRSGRDRWHDETPEVRRSYRRRATRGKQRDVFAQRVREERCETPPPAPTGWPWTRRREDPLK